MMIDLTDKIAIVTGGASGIGRGICLVLARQGASVAVTDINLDGAETVSEEVAALGGKASAIELDVTDKRSAAEVAANVLGQFGKIDILVNNAGVVGAANWWQRAMPDDNDWDAEHASRCFVHLSNSLVWRAVTGDGPPTVPPTSEEYTRAGLPWFEYYGGDLQALEGAETLGGLKSVTEVGDEKGDSPLPENVSVSPENVITLRQGLRKDEVREGVF